MKPLEKEFKYYIKHQDELLKEYKGKYVVIKGNKVLGAYKTELEAIEETSKSHELGTFLVQHVDPGDKSILQTFHSRVIFAK